jgi:hypothetical protein
MNKRLGLKLAILTCLLNVLDDDEDGCDGDEEREGKGRRYHTMR